MKTTHPPTPLTSHLHSGFCGISNSKIIGKFCDVEARCLLLSHHRLVGANSVTPMYSPTWLPLLSQSSDPPQKFQDACVLSVSPSWLNIQNPGWLCTSTPLFLTSSVYGNTFQSLFCLTLFPPGLQANSAPPSLINSNYIKWSLLPPLTFPVLFKCWYYYLPSMNTSFPWKQCTQTHPESVTFLVTPKLEITQHTTGCMFISSLSPSLDFVQPQYSHLDFQIDYEMDQKSTL